MVEISEDVTLDFERDCRFEYIKVGTWFLAKDFYGGGVRRGTHLLQKISERDARYTDGSTAQPDRNTSVRKVDVKFTVTLQDLKGD